MAGREVDAVFISVARHDKLEDGLSDLSQQAYLEYIGRDTDPDYVNESLVLHQQVKTLLEELERKRKTLKRTHTQLDDHAKELGRPRTFDKILDASKK